MRQSELCASCHTLITEAFGPDGRVIGSLPEQMNFQEWRHSAFYDEGRSCQSCHMPRADGPIRVSSVLGAERDGLSRHAFVGGNAFMLRLMNRFRDGARRRGAGRADGSDGAAHRAAAAARRRPPSWCRRRAFNGASVEFDVTVRNLAGHKYPDRLPVHGGRGCT